MRFSPFISRVACRIEPTRLPFWARFLFQLSVPMVGKPHFGKITTLAWSPNGRLLVVGTDDHAICVWDTVTDKIVHTYTKHADSITALAWSPDSRLVASGSAEQIHIWEAATGQQLGVYISPTGKINDLAWSPNGRLLASADRKIHIWRIPLASG